MSLKHSIASKKRWVGISDEERKRKMSEIAKRRWSKTSPQARRKYALKMVQARIEK